MKHLAASVLVLLLPVPATASLADTVGWTGGCTVVVVHPDGWALTAEHCEHPGSFTVDIAGRKVQARRVFDPPGYWKPQDRACLVKLEGERFAWAQLASQPMQVGDKFYSWGFPNGQSSYITGTIIPAEVNGRRVLAANGAAIGGHSGGPLFNERGEVCGLLSQSDRANISIWIPLDSLQSAMRYMQSDAQQADRVVWVLTSQGCLPCENLKADYQRGQFPGIDMRFVDGHSAEGQVLRNRIAQATGEFPRYSPTLWAEGASTFTTGYSGVGTLRSWLVTALRLPLTFWEVITGDRQQSPPSTPPETEPFPSPAPEIKPEAEPDGLVPEYSEPEPADPWGGITVVLLAAEQDVSALKGFAREQALQRLSGAVERQFGELTGGKAQLAIVAQRTQPTRYAAVCEAASVLPEKAHVLVLVPSQSEGVREWVRGKVLSLVRNHLPEQVHSAPVDLVTEAASKAVFVAVNESLATQEPGEGGDPASDLPMGDETGWLSVLWYPIRRLLQWYESRGST